MAWWDTISDVIGIVEGVGTIVGGFQQNEAAGDVASAATVNARRVMELADLNLEAIDENIETIREASRITRDDLAREQAELTAGIQFNREEIAAGIGTVTEQAQLAATQLARKRERTLGAVRARAAGSGVRLEGSPEDLVQEIGIDFRLEGKEIDLALGTRLGELERAKRQNEFQFESSLLTLERDLAVANYNEQVAIRREENRKKILTKQAQIAAANQMSRAGAASSAGENALLGSLFEGAGDIFDVLGKD